MYIYIYIYKYIHIYIHILVDTSSLYMYIFIQRGIHIVTETCVYMPMDQHRLDRPTVLSLIKHVYICIHA